MANLDFAAAVLAILGAMEELRVPDHPLPPLDVANTIDEVLVRLQAVIDWAIEVSSSLGYFAVLYKRATMAIRDARLSGKFDHPERMENFDIMFANRYFHACNAYFHPHEWGGLSDVWKIAFIGHEHDATPTTILQQMLTGLKAHIGLDLGIAAQSAGSTDLSSLQHDFDLINALIASQVEDVLDVLGELSPRSRWILRLVPNQDALVNRMIKKSRDSAWLFAIGLAFHRDQWKELIANQDTRCAYEALKYLDPPKGFGVVDWMIRSIAERESQDVPGNIAKLDVVADRPAALKTKFM